MSLELAAADTRENFIAEAVRRIDACGVRSQQEQGRFSASLSGGNTPKDVNRLWAGRSALDWKSVVLLFGDERCVPPGHPDSNFGMTEQTLLRNLPERPTVHRMHGENPDPENAALDYEKVIRTSLGSEGRLDLAILGLGPDGHTASLFPGAEILSETKKLCGATPAPDGKMQRLTLTVPVLKKARQIIVLAAGADKAEVVNRIVNGPLMERELPAQLFIRDHSLKVTLLLDGASAARL